MSTTQCIIPQAKASIPVRSFLLFQAAMFAAALIRFGGVHLEAQTPHVVSNTPFFYALAQQDPNAQAPGSPDSTDPPSQVARLSFLSGNASVQPASVPDFSPAEVNYPLTNGDRLYTDRNSAAELQTGSVALRLGAQTDLTVSSMTDSLMQFGLAAGAVHLRSYNLDPGTTLELDTPNVSVTVLQPGDVRVDVDPNSDTTSVCVLSGAVQVDGNGLSQQAGPKQCLQLTGTATVQSQAVRSPRPDGLDTFYQQREQAYQNDLAREAEFVSPGTIGAADLEESGDWQSDAVEGPVWYPRAVAVDWQPYRFGHWAWIAPWGWTWVEAEPWGFAPFHYGRWARFGPRWGWIPGPRVVRPVYCPALVVFVGGPRFAGPAVTAWFPLGPREPYAPWYHGSPLYVNRVNVTNIYNRNAVEVRSIYAERTRNLYAGAAPGWDRGYHNREVATVAVSQASFASGRPVQGAAVRLNPAQWNNAPLLPHPLVTPERPIVDRGPARAVPLNVNRPTLASRDDRRFSPAEVQGTPPLRNPGQQNPGQRNPAQQNLGQRNPDQGSQGQRYPDQGSQGQRYPDQRYPTQRNPDPARAPAAAATPPPAQSVQPSRTGVSPAPVVNGVTPRYQPRPQPAPAAATPVQPSPTAVPSIPAERGGVMAPAPARTIEALPAADQQRMQAEQQRRAQQPQGRFNDQQRQQNPQQPVQQNVPQPAQQPVQQPVSRELQNRAVPQTPRPSFEQQRQVIQGSDPGRPPGPRQLDNVRQSQPAGSAPQREAAPHPSAPPPPPAARPAPAAAPPPAREVKPEPKK